MSRHACPVARPLESSEDRRSPWQSRAERACPVRTVVQHLCTTYAVGAAADREQLMRREGLERAGASCRKAGSIPPVGDRPGGACPVGSSGSHVLPSVLSSYGPRTVDIRGGRS